MNYFIMNNNCLGFGTIAICTERDDIRDINEYVHNLIIEHIPEAKWTWERFVDEVNSIIKAKKKIDKNKILDEINKIPQNSYNYWKYIISLNEKYFDYRGDLMFLRDRDFKIICRTINLDTCVDKDIYDLYEYIDMVFQEC